MAASNKVQVMPMTASRTLAEPDRCDGGNRDQGRDPCTWSSVMLSTGSTRVLVTSSSRAAPVREGADPQLDAEADERTWLLVRPRPPAA